MKANYYVHIREGYIEFFTTLEEAEKVAKKYGVKVHESEHAKTRFQLDEITKIEKS